MKILKIKRSRMGIRFFGGANWMDLTGNCVSQIVEFTNTHQKFVRRFRWTLCADEIFFQTIICNYIKNIEIEKKVLRYIDWNTGPEKPRTLRTEDYQKIKESDALFARKFNPGVDSEIMRKICADIGWETKGE